MSDGGDGICIGCKAAGLLLYTKCGQVLTGYTPKLGKWSGFGGKIEEGESPWDAAVREVYEELFGSSERDFIKDVTQMTIRNGDYIVFPICVERILERQPAGSTYYSGAVSSIDELCNGRLLVEGQEITDVKLMSVRDIMGESGDDMIDDSFREDVMRWMLIGG